MLRSFKSCRSLLPIGFGVFYLAVISSFATVYYVLPDHFYHSTIQHEASIREDGDFIKAELIRTIKASYKEQYGDSSIIKGANGWAANLDDLNVETMSYRDRTFYFHLKLPKRQNAESDASIVNGDDSLLSLKLPEFYVGVADDIVRNMRASADGHFITPIPTDWNVLTILGADQKALHVKPKPLIFDVPLHERMLAYAGAMEGFPGRASGSFGRMFYLSTVTITTLGYGDILPITPLARMLVSVEAIVGTIIIGLYLWALTRQIEMRRDNKPPE
jgi:Ion channel